MANDNIHKNHRKRMREKFDKIGFNGWSVYEILEYMLYNVYRQGDTNPVAHSLLSYSAESIVTLLENSTDMRLANDVKYVGENTVLFLRSLLEFIKFYKREELRFRPMQLTRHNMKEIINLVGFSTGSEDILMICLDNFMNVKGVVNITEKSSETSARSDVKTVVSTAMNNGTKKVILVHNHPDGCKYPSTDDINMTMRIDAILRNMNIEFIDHFILCYDEIISIKACLKEDDEYFDQYLY